jgi:ATP-dependent 26S proteasome regulatory subunit
MVGGSENSIKHVLAELSRVDLKIRLQAVRLRLESNQRNEDEFQGVYISEEEVDSILGGHSLKGDSGLLANPDSPLLKTLTDELKRIEAEIAEIKSESLRHGDVLRLVKLGEMFRLSPFDIDALLICLLPELDLRYERLYAYLQDDVTKKSPSIELVLRLLCQSFADRLAAREAFSPQAPLLKYHLLQFDDSPSTKATSSLVKPLKVNERISSYVLGSDQIDSQLLPFASLVKPQIGLADVILDDAIKSRLIQLMQRQGKNLVCYFQGAYGAGKQTTAEALCHDFSLSLLVIDMARLLAAELPFAVATRLIFREAELQGTALYWDHFDLLLADDKKLHLDSLVQALQGYPGLNFLAGETPWEQTDVLSDVPFIRIHFPIPAYSARKQLWQAQLNGHLPLAQDVDLADLSNKFLFTGGQIRDAMAGARNLALWRASEELSRDDLYAACRAQSNQKLGTLSHKLECKYTWTDIVLPEDQMQQLHEITGYVKHHQLVYGEWSFDKKLSLGKGLNTLFAGPSGTGKTMAAGIMANELKLDIYKIDLSTVVSKYIGETEKNLAKIFKEAETSNAILFFDEADALFGKRSEVRDSHDRYANIEISYLLQKMEEYEGMVILATNLRKNMDDAFVRRMHFIVEFPFPEEEYRYRIWKNIFPKEAPLDEGVDFEFLGRQFKISGGNIKNIALSAAFLAADGDSAITMKHLIHATKREFRKMGKLCIGADFGKYHNLIAGG